MSLAVLNYLWESLHSTVVLTWYVILISMLFGWVGFVVLSWLKSGIKAEVFGSTSIVTGVGISSAVGWYLFHIGLPLEPCRIVLFFSGIGFVSVRFLMYVFHHDGVEVRSVRSEFLSSALFRLLMITLYISAFRVLSFHSSQISIGDQGNPDFYSWSTMADALIGRYDLLC
jgi:hypothetical protein